MVNTTHKTKPFPPETAGRKMITGVPLIKPNQTIAEIESMLLEKTKEMETINYIYVIDEIGKLIGVISIKEVFRSPKETQISKLMTKDLITVGPYTDQERVAVLAIKHSLKAVPVINRDGLFLGVIPSDTILEILHHEHIEDALLSVGVRAFKDPIRSIILAPAKVHFRKRLPWLILGLAGGILAAFVVGIFEEPLKVQLLLAAFIPAIVYMADAVGTQTQTILIRSLAIEHKLKLKNYIRREILVGLLLASVLGIIMMFASFVWQKSLLLSVILGISFFLTIIIAMTVAVVLPLIFLKLKSDPAIASGPCATIIRDILSLIIYFLVASLMLNLFK